MPPAVPNPPPKMTNSGSRTLIKNATLVPSASPAEFRISIASRSPLDAARKTPCDGRPGRKFFEHGMQFCTTVRTRCAQRAAGHQDCVSVNTFQRLTVLHQAGADPGADGDVHKKTLFPSCAENRLSACGSANIRFHSRRCDCRKPLLNGLAAPRDRATAGHVSVAINQLGNACGDSSDRDFFLFCFGP